MLVQGLAKLLNNERLAQRLGIVDVGRQPAFDETDWVLDLQGAGAGTCFTTPLPLVLCQVSEPVWKFGHVLY